MAAVTICSDFGAPQKVSHCFHCFPIYLAWSDGTRCHDLSFLNVEFLSQLFNSPLSSGGSLILFHFLPQRCCHLHIWGYWYFSHLSWFRLVLHPAWHFTWCTLLLLLLSRFSCVQICATAEMAAYQDPPSLGFSRQEHWSGLPFPSPMRESEVVQSCPTLSDPMDCRLPGSSVHGIFQARVLEWGAIAFSEWPNSSVQ